jgi:hypothetical protein
MESSILALALVAFAQVPEPSPTLPLSGVRHGSTRVERIYGEPEPIDLWTLSAGRFHRHTVITKGRVRQLDARGEYFEISEDNGRAVLFGVPEIERSLSGFVGKRVEVIGLVRDLVAAQGMCLSRAQRVPQSLCDDPELPPTPDLTLDRGSWPPVSITAWSIQDVTPLDAKEAQRDFATTLGGNPGEKVKIVGRFGGANLDAAAVTAAPAAGAWVLRGDDGAVWILGKAPRGEGWSLDPAYRGDLGRWLEVEGTLIRCGSAVCLRARRVLLSVVPRTAPRP